MGSMNKSALCGEPSYVWRAGQERRLRMVLEAAAGDLQENVVLENGCGVGMYVAHLVDRAAIVVGLEYDFERARQAAKAVRSCSNAVVVNAAGEHLPFQSRVFNLILSHEVLEHVQDDRQAMKEMARTSRPGGRIAVFVPNRGYPFETHGIFWKGEYHFGNMPLVNYLPRGLRDRLAPHVRVYSKKDLKQLLNALPVKIIRQTIIYGAYDNIIARSPRWGKALRSITMWLENTPLGAFGLSHFWVLEKTGEKDSG